MAKQCIYRFCFYDGTVFCFEPSLTSPVVNFLQGDVKFAEVLEKMGCKVSWTENSVTVTGPPRDASGRKHLRAIDVNMNKMPDVAMTLAVVALYADGPTAIRDGMPSPTLCYES